MLRNRVDVAMGVAWLVLMAATLLNFWVSSSRGTAPIGASVVDVIVVAIAMIKVRIVGWYFMELRDAPQRLQILFDSVVAATFLVLAAILLATD